MRRSLKTGMLLAGLSAIAAAYAFAAPGDQRPGFVNYGTGASIRQGDNDHRQAMYLSVPATTAGKLYVRVLDPDTVNYYDQMDKRFATTRTRFTVFGGEGAFIPEPTDPEKLTEQELTAGTKLAERLFGRERKFDDKWETIAELDPSQGEKVGDRIIFRLVVDAISGPNGNVYDVALSTNGDDNVTPAGLQVFGYTPTVRMPRRGVQTELKFRIPDDATSLVIGNFDAAYGESFLTTKLASYPLLASGQGQWASTTIAILDRDRGEDAAVTLSGGAEYPNDATFYVTGNTGKLLPFELPPRVLDLNARPIPIGSIDPKGSCMTVSFDGSKSYDPEGGPITQVWRFGDGTSSDGPIATHEYTEEGHFNAALEVVDTSAQLGNGAVLDVQVFVKNPPVALSDKALSFPSGEEMTFDGNRSSASKWRIATHEWKFSDGTVLTGAVVNRAFAPGTYEVVHTVVDDSGHPCNTATETFTVRSNAGPVADAGPDQRIAILEETVFDAGKTTDADNEPLEYAWDLGDGTKMTGPVVRHAYASPGTYTVKLDVRDEWEVANSADDDTMTVIVNDPPVPVAGADRPGAIGELFLFDASESTDPDGQIVSYHWDFGDGTSDTGRRVLHGYANSGNYPVTLTITDDSTTRTETQKDTLTVVVNQPPIARAGADRRGAIDEVFAFDGTGSTDSDGKLITYAWDFGDGATAAGATASHAYEKSGKYPVRLTITDDSATSTQTVEDALIVTVNEPPVPVAGPDQSVAIAEPVTFDAAASADGDGRIIAYAWDFGDGATATSVKPTITHAYAKSGTYPVTLTVTDDSITSTAATTDSLSVRVNEPPVADAGSDQLVTASAVQFDGSVSSDLDDEVAKYDWDFGDGKTGSGAKPTHVYAKPGTYDVKLTVTDASGTIRSSAEDRVEIVVNAVPIADAGPDLVGAPGERLVFQGSRSLDSDGSIAEYSWDFRDGATASGKIVEHAFDNPGTYAVRLKVKDNTGQDEAVDYAETQVFINKPPVADAGADVLAVPGDEIKFSGAHSFDSDGEIVAYRWDFGDMEEPVMGGEIARTFNEPGIYSVQLTVTDDSGADNSLATDSVRIAINHAPVADAGPDIVDSQSTITFDAGRSVDADGDALIYSWDFGDGSTATGPVAVHTYAEGGTYPVVLTVNDGTRLKNAVSRDAISVTINRPPVAVAGKNERVCTGDIVVLDGSASSDPEGGVLRYSWDMGDGSTSEIVNPTKSYTRGGTYPVTLTVRDDSGFPNGTASSQIAVRVDQGPIASAGKDVLACAKTEVAFDGSASTDIDGVVNSFSWDFGDGSFGAGERPVHIFERPGTYRVFLRIEGEKAGICDSSSTDEIEARIIEGPVAVIKAPAAVPLTETIAFDGSESYMADGAITAWKWDFGDGQAAEGQKVEHRYEKAGAYQVSLTLTSDSTSPSCQQVSSRHLIVINAPPVASAGEDKHVAVDELTVFDASASHDPDGGIIAYEWDFGDGTVATGIQVTHRYAEPGTYTAALFIRDEADLANSTVFDEVTVTVNPPPAPEIAGPAVACVDEQVAWRPNPGTGNASYEWRFGDGKTVSSAEAAHSYAKPGWYSLALFADDGKARLNSRQQSTMTVHVNQPPHAAAGPDQLVCPGDAVAFDGSLSADPDGQIKLYRWDFGDGATSDGDKVDHIFAKPGTYRVTLTVTDDAGSTCSAVSDTLDVVVNAPPVPDPGTDREVFIGGANDAVLLDGSASGDPDGEALAHDWQTGDGGSELGERVRHTFTTAGEFPVTLTVTDTSGLACGTALKTVKITARERE